MVRDDRIGASGTPPECAAGVTGATGSTGAAGAKTDAAGAAGAKTDAAGAAGATPQPGPGEFVRRVVIPSVAAMAINPTRPGDAAQTSSYLEQVLREAGSPSDPLRCMLIQQFAVAHLRGLDLHAKSAAASVAEEAGVYGSAAARIMGELSKLALVIAQLEARATPRPTAPAARPAVSASPAGDPPRSRTTRSQECAALGTAPDGAQADAPETGRAHNDPDCPLGKGQTKDPNVQERVATKPGAGEVGPVPGARRRGPHKSPEAAATD